ncbi:PAS domain S-box protein [Salinigranum marinum]|uniref:PAS domain-containing protein n=1 Tax=Salinigranum marinum TaxID=1515595 RepID=UPI002989F6EF|nr:PAS domain S-box protein [Salinigranum marinum]
MGEPTRSPTEGSAIIAASIDGAGLVEGETFVTANRELAVSFGYDTSDALVGTPWRELYPRAECKRIESEVLPGVRPERGWRGEVEGVRRDGSPFLQALSVRRTVNGRLVWVVRDRSERVDHQPNSEQQPRSDRKTAENGDTRIERNAPKANGTDGPTDLPESRNRTTRFHPFVETAPVPIAVFTADRGIVYCNAKAAEFLGAEDQTDVIGTEPERFVHPEHRDRARQRISRVLEDREATEPREYRLLGLDDEERYGEIAAAPVAYNGEPGAYVLINDVTRLKRSQEELRRERQFLEAVINTVEDIVYVLDAEAQLRLWNETLGETTGYTSEEIGSMHAKEFVPEGEHEYVPGLLASMDASEDRRVELSLLTKDGESIEHDFRGTTYEFRGTTFEDPETGEVFRCGVARDITDRLELKR